MIYVLSFFINHFVSPSYPCLASSFLRTYFLFFYFVFQITAAGCSCVGASAAARRLTIPSGEFSNKEVSFCSVVLVLLACRQMAAHTSFHPTVRYFVYYCTKFLNEGLNHQNISIRWGIHSAKIPESWIEQKCHIPWWVVTCTATCRQASITNTLVQNGSSLLIILWSDGSWVINKPEMELIRWCLVKRQHGSATSAETGLVLPHNSLMGLLASSRALPNDPQWLLSGNLW